MKVQTVGKRVAISTAGITADSVALAKKGCLYNIFAKCFKLNAKVTLEGRSYLLNKNSLKHWLARRGTHFSTNLSLELLITRALENEKHLPPIILPRQQEKVVDISKLEYNADAFKQRFKNHPQAKAHVQALTPAEVNKLLRRFDETTITYLSDDQIKNLDLNKLYYNTFGRTCFRVLFETSDKAKEHVELLSPNQISVALQHFDGAWQDHIPDEKIPQLDFSSYSINLQQLFSKSPDDRKRAQLLTSEQIIHALNNYKLPAKVWPLLSNDQLNKLSSLSLGYSTKRELDEELARRLAAKYEKMNENLTNAEIPGIDINELCKQEGLFKKMFIEHPEAKKRVALLNATQVLQAFHGILWRTGRDEFLKLLTDAQLKELFSAVPAYFIRLPIKSEIDRRKPPAAPQFGGGFHPRPQFNVPPMGNPFNIPQFNNMDDFMRHFGGAFNMNFGDFGRRPGFRQPNFSAGFGTFPNPGAGFGGMTGPTLSFTPLKNFTIREINLKAAGASEFQELYDKMIKAHTKTGDYEGVFDCSKGCGSKAIQNKAKWILHKLHPDRTIGKPEVYRQATEELGKHVAELRTSLVKAIDEGLR